nr:MAG TPA: hypothetical protein [Caudoviricetes sp.]
MTARQMFEEQRYKRNEENEEITYSQRFGSGYFRITFDLSKEEIAIDTNMENVIESDLLQAIIQQAKELGWLEEEKQEIKQETNYEHYKDLILECCIDNLALVKGIPKPCSKIDCNDCDFLTIRKECCEIAKDWLNQQCMKPIYKLTKFEKELLQCYSDISRFNVFNSLNEMKEKGYFKGIDDNEIIGDILANCEVVG